MVVTRSQCGPEAEERRVFDQPPRSPSRSNATVRPQTRDTTDANEMLRPPQSDAIGVATQPALLTTATTSSAPRMPMPVHVRYRPARSTRSTASAVAKLKYEAEQRLANIRRKELEIEADLVRKKLSADIAELEDEASDRDSEPMNRAERVQEWLDKTAVEDTIRGEPPHNAYAHAADAATAVVPEPVRPIDASTPAPRQARCDWPATKERGRSATPRGRGIEQLADTLDRMLRDRPPPRQATELPKFTGSPLEWLQFSAAMRETTTVYKFSPMENLARLRNCLSGAAYETVAPLMSTAQHPDVIMKTLEQCFGRPEMLVNLAFEELRRLPRIGSATTDLNMFAVKVQNIVAVLTNVNKGYLCNPQLAGEVLEKLTPHLKSRWYDFAYEDQTPCPELIKISKFLMREADRALRYGFVPTSHPPQPPARKEPSRPAAPAARPEQRRKPVYSAVASDEETRCPVCSEAHQLPSCPKFRGQPYAERWATVKRAGVCYRCLSSRHRRVNCRKGACGKNGCKRPHHRMLHSDTAADVGAAGAAPHAPTNVATANAATSAAATSAAPDAAATKTETTTAASTNDGAVKLKICPVTITGKKGSVDTYALFDEGSTVTLVDEDLARRVGADGPLERLDIRGINKEQQHQKSRRVEVAVKGTHHDHAYTITARTLAGLNLTSQSIPAGLLRLQHLRDLNADQVVYGNAKPKILIGTDNWELIVTRELRTGGPKEPAASRTELGWVIHGTAPNRSLRCDNSVLHITTGHTSLGDEQLSRLVEHHFKIDSLGVSLTARHASEEHKRAVATFESTVAHEDGRYIVGLPWRRDGVQLPPSYNAALKRLKNLEAKLDRHPEEKKEYHAQMAGLIQKGYAERSNECERDSKRAWYLPHFAVRNPNKPGKVRLVFDAAAKTNGVSLNDELLEGPDLLRSLQTIMFRFREGAYAVTADIQEMFLRVKIAKEDQAAQLFLWRDRPTDEPTVMKMTSMLFGASSSPFLAHSVRNHNARRYATTHPMALRPITESHYMDDFVESFNDMQEAKETIAQVDEVHQKADFHLRGWTSNRAELIAGIRTDRRAAEGETPLSEGEKMLGLRWNSSTDCLSFNTALHKVPDAVRSRARPPTKREALSAVMSIYDPLGLLSCYTIAAKIALQKLWRVKTGWDEPLPLDVAEEFDAWLASLKTIDRLRIPRSYNGGREVRRRELHVFCDASEEAYAAVAYWRLYYGADSAIETALVTARAKVAPLKAQTVPRLELQAALIGLRLAKTIKEEHRIKADDTTYWSDSQTVLHWIRNGSKKYTPFVAHRLGEITESSHPKEWRWVPTHLNVADVATRAGYVPANEEDRWFTGPAFLKRPKSEWPRPPEERGDTHITETVCMVVGGDRSAALPDIERFSSYDRLIGATAQVLLFAQRCRDKTAKLNNEHVQRATHLWLQQAQQDSFGQDIDHVKRGSAVPRTSRLHRYDVTYENKLLRLNGRVDKADVSMAVKRPILLDGRHAFTRLLIEREHRRAGHAGNERVVNDIRQKYWVLRLRPTIRAIAAACLICKMRWKKPQSAPIGDLPPERLQPYRRPFSYCGVDYFGPIVVAIGRRREKRWCALFTCLTTRAVHLELVASLTTDSAIMALRRMAARRGWPAVIYSDNGTNFRGADVELRKAYEEWLPEMTRTATLYDTTWKFIPPGAPNQGGAWERLVRSVKTALAVTLKEKAPKEETLHTLLTEAEHTVNSRPLTHVSVNPDDPEALTPNHFLVGSSTGLPHTGPCEESDRRAWRAAQALADRFWRRWVREYLPTLVPRHDEHRRRDNVKTGDVVIVADHALPRNTWPRGVVARTYPGPDGVVRIADIQTRAGTFRRPTSKFVVLQSAPSWEHREGTRCVTPSNTHSALSPDQRERTRCTSGCLREEASDCAPSPGGGC